MMQFDKLRLPVVRSVRWALFLAFALGFAVPASAQQVPGGKLTSNVSPQTLSDAFAEITRMVEPAVVNIDTKGKVPEVTAKGEAPAGEPGDIMDFFRRQLPRRPVYAVGSGFIVDKAGYIITNLHVIEDASRISVKLPSGQEFPAEVVGTDDETDLAVLKINAGRDLPFIKFGNSDEARVGEWVLAIGSPFGLARTVTAGIVSQTRRETPQASPFQKFIQTDAAINKGNSGGPLVNMAGEVIGVNSQIATSTGDFNGVGFALPSNDAANVVQQIVKNGKVRRGYLGVALESVKAEFAKVYNLGDSRGAIITDIRDKQSPAAVAGLKVGDVIVELNGQKVDGATDLITKVSSATPGEAIRVLYLREAGAGVDRKTAEIKLTERPSINTTAGGSDTRRKLPLDKTKEEERPFGLTLTELTTALAASYKLEGQKGVVVKEVNPASYIADVRMSNGSEALGEGDLIRRINRVPITDLKTFNETVRKLKTGDAVVMEVISYNAVNRAQQLKVVQFTVQ